MSARASLTKRRGQHGQQREGAAQDPLTPPAHKAAVPSAGVPQLKAWHLWTLFGVGWPSIVLFFLSSLKAFPPRVQGVLLLLGWLFCGFWWLSTVAGVLSDHQSNKQTQAFKANLVMACIGSTIGCIFLTVYAYYNWPMLYVAALAVAFAVMFFVRSLDEDDSPAGAHESSTADAAVSSDDTPAITLDRMSALTRSLSAPQATTIRLLEQAAAMAAELQSTQQEAAEAAAPQLAAAAHGSWDAAHKPACANAAAPLGAADVTGAALPQVQDSPVLELTLHQALSAGIVALMPVDHVGAAAAGPEGLITFHQAAEAGVLLTSPLYVASASGQLAPAVGFILTPAVNAVLPAQAAPAGLPAQAAALGSGRTIEEAAALAGVMPAAAPAAAAPLAPSGTLSMEQAAAAAGLLGR